MLYKALFFLLAPFFVFSQEYEIKSDLVEIDTEENKLIYSGKVNFTSENISFQAEKLVIIRNRKSFLLKEILLNFLMLRVKKLFLEYQKNLR